MRKLTVTLLLSALFLFALGLILVGPISAQAPDTPPAKGTDFSPPSPETPPAVSPLSQIERGLLAKIEPQLMKQLLTAPETVPFIVYLEAKTDVQTVAASALGASDQGQDQELVKRTAIVAALQQTARDSQTGVLQLLTRSAAPGGLSGQSAATSEINALWIVNGVAARGTLETVLALAARPEVEMVRLDKEIRLNVPDLYPARLTRSTGLLPLRQAPQWGIAKVRADLVQQALGIDGSGVVVANVDSGVDWQHPDLQSSYRGYSGPGHLPQHVGNWYDATGGGATYPVDGNGHGTHTMGTIVGGNGVGVAPGSRWIAVRAFNSFGSAQNSWLHDAYQWLLAPNGDPTLAPDVVNNSWSNNNGSNTEFEADIQALLNAGIYPVFSAGNNGPQSGSVGSPASLDSAFAVGATDIEDAVTNFSGRGPSAWDKLKPEISAPGKEVVSTFPGGAYGTLDGTSMAAPHVAGLAALMLQAKPGLRADLPAISEVMTTTAVPLGDPVPNNNYGWGRIDAYNAVMAVAGSGTLRGAVTQVGGSAIDKARIQIVPRAGGPTVNTTAAADGIYLQGLAAGTYDVTASGFGYQPLTAFNVNIVTNSQTIQNFALLPTLTGTLRGTVRDKNTNAPLAASLSLPGTPATGATNPADGSYNLTLPVGTYTVRVLAEGYRIGQATNITINDGATVTQDFALDPAPSILLVDSGKWYQGSQINYYQQALYDALYDYDLRRITTPFDEVSDVPITSTLTAYDIVVWSAPQDSPGYVGADAALRGFLDEGGKLLLSGQDVAFFDQTLSNYLDDYLRVKFVEDNAASEVVTGTTNGALAGLSLTIAGAGGADNQVSPDVIAVADEDFARPLLAYDTEEEQLAGVQVELCVPYRAMFLSFGLEGINNRAQRSQMMAQSLEWLMQAPPATGVELTEESVTKVGNFDTVVTHTVRIRNIGTSNDSYNLASTSNWPLNPAPPPTVALDSCQSEVITVGVRVQTTDWHTADTWSLTATSANNVSDSATRITKSPAPVLLVDDDRFFSFAEQYQTAFDRNNIPYDYQLIPKAWQGQFPPSPSAATLQMYPVVVWYTAYDWFQPLVPDEEERLAAYLDSGGRLFFSSQDYIYTLPDNAPGPFAEKYLGVLEHTEDYSSSTIIGQPNNPISTNWPPTPLTFPPGYQNHTDGLQPTAQAQIVTLGEEGQANSLLTGGSGSRGPWRTHFAAYGPELLPEAQQTKLLQRIVGWLGWLGTSKTEPDRAEALAGEVINYTAVITNDGWADIQTAHFTATFPAELALVGTAFSPELSLVDGQLVWSGPLAKNERKVFNYAATVADPLPLGSVVSQTSWVAYDDHDIVVDRLTNVCVNCPNLQQSTFTANPAQKLRAGDTLTFTLVLRNSGLVDDPAVKVTNTVPLPLELVELGQPSRGNVSQNDQSLTWTTPVSKNEAVTLTYRTVVSYQTSQPIENVAYVVDSADTPMFLRALANYQVFSSYFPVIRKE